MLLILVAVSTPSQQKKKKCSHTNAKPHSTAEALFPLSSLFLTHGMGYANVIAHALCHIFNVSLKPGSISPSPRKMSAVMHKNGDTCRVED